MTSFAPSRLTVKRSAANAAVAGLYAITPEESDTGILVSKARQALSGGARLLQYRNKSAGRAARLLQAQSLLELCRRMGVPLVVNDDLELAVEVGADGVHLGREDGEVAAARSRIGSGMLLGVSCYDRLDLALVARGAGADYVAFGAVFDSPTKPAAVRAPLGLFRQARAQLDLPIVAIGGITPQNAPSVIEAGASAVAVITAVFGARDIEAAAKTFSNLFSGRGS